MFSKLLVLGAATLCFAAASASHAATRLDMPEFSHPAKAQAQRLLGVANVDTQGRMVTVRAAIDPDGKVTGVRVVRSSGSRDTDRTIEAVLQTVIHSYPPLGLMDGSVTMSVGDARFEQAETQ